MGTFLFQFGDFGQDDGCLYYPRKVVLSKFANNFIVCDKGPRRSRLQGGQLLDTVIIRFVRT